MCPHGNDGLQNLGRTMIRITVDEKKCLLAQGKQCKNCILICPKHVLGIREGRIHALRQQECIACHCCKGTCPQGLDVILVEELSPVTDMDVPTIGPFSETLKVRVGDLILPTPLVLASGPIGRCSRGWVDAVAAGCGAVVTKTITPVPWPGNPAVRILTHQRDSLLNCEGLPNLGAHITADEVKRLKALGSQFLLIVSITAAEEMEFVEMAKLFEDAGADGLEIAIMGCPNYRPGTVIADGIWNDDPARTFGLIQAIRKAVTLPLWIKGAQKLEVALACEEAGADALLVRSGSLRAMPLDPVTGKPLLSHPRGEGSLTGPYTKLPGLKIVADFARRVKIPIIGNGGITCGQDVVDYFMAGASAVELLTVAIRQGLRIVPKIICETESYLKNHKFKNLAEIRGKVFRYVDKS